MSKDKETLEFTGERMMPAHNNGDLVFFEHISRYFFAAQAVKGKIVLDIACGEGYGVEYIANQGAKEVIGIDVNEQTIAHAKKKYKKDNLTFFVGDAEKIPLKDGSVDMIVSFETIEHVRKYKEFIKETKRVLKKEGVVIFSTPNKDVFSGNPFHTKEFSLDELIKELGVFYKNIDIYFQTNIVSTTISKGEWLKQDDLSSEKAIKKGKQSPEESMYFLAVCGDFEIPTLERKILLNNSRELSNLYSGINDREEKIRAIEGEGSISKEQVNKNNQEIREKTRQIKQKEKELRKIYTSNSWKITAPLRKIREILINIRKATKSR